jgi:hypothetical protein
MRKTLIAIAAAAALLPASAWAGPYEEGAKLDIANLATEILAASLCKNLQFGDEAQVVKHIFAASLILGNKGVTAAYLAATKTTVDQMEAVGREVWCADTIAAAKRRESDLLTEVPK